ncbi:helix-turn-helix transcriptional regulator [Dietzia aerolata]|uniref:Helix-turn-helix domain-containing protein n=1 Tax=Dietzia aerolata TaxID=595984 RepID=A0ABV5JPA7_9ACTN|nr:helix-turn-helix transcriptional regulator [Dietzia aerolata]MBB0969473.1 helix-turn-helix transcriptional regulator [Dietzia aerolata]
MESGYDGVSAADWADELTRRVGDAMRTRRNELGISAAAVADRTKRLGYPITRSTIAKIESGSRASKLDLTELLILALALQTTPAALMFSDAPDGESRVFPAAPPFPSGDSYEWWCGETVGAGIWDVEHDRDSLARVSSLRRLIRIRNAKHREQLRLYRAQGKGYGDSPLLLELDEDEVEAARQAARDGWTVKGYGEHDDG